MTAAPAWFSTLGEPLDEAEHADIAAYLAGLAMMAPVHAVRSWQEAGAVCAQPAEAWWGAEERERARLEQTSRLHPEDLSWLDLNEALHGAAAGAAGYAAYQARLALAAHAAATHPFLRKYALYCGGRWPLGVYQGRFAIF